MYTFNRSALTLLPLDVVCCSPKAQRGLVGSSNMAADVSTGQPLRFGRFIDFSTTMFRLHLRGVFRRAQASHQQRTNSSILFQKIYQRKKNTEAAEDNHALPLDTRLWWFLWLFYCRPTLVGKVVPTFAEYLFFENDCVWREVFVIISSDTR